MRYSLEGAKTWAREHLKGYVPVVFTPYDDRGRLDEKALRADISYTLRLPSVGGLYVGSIYQEFWALTTQERMRLAEIVIDETSGRVPVTVSASHTAPDDAIELAQHAHRSGADLVMLWPPYFGPRSDESVVDYYRTVLREVPIGFAFYNSGLSEVGFQLGPEALAELAREPQMVLLKEASLRLDTYLQTLKAIGEDVMVSSPLEEFWLVGRMIRPDLAPEVLFGSSRSLFLQTPTQPKLHEFYVSATAGDWKACQEQLDWILAAGEQLHASSLRAGSHPVGLIKKLRAVFGQSGGETRPPIPSASDEQVASAVEGLRRMGVSV